MYTEAKQKSTRIRALLNAKCIQQGEIARALKVTKGYVSHCLAIDPKTGDFRRKDPYIREGIAKHLGMTYRELWDEPTPFYSRRKESESGHDNHSKEESSQHQLERSSAIITEAGNEVA